MSQQQEVGRKVGCGAPNRILPDANVPFLTSSYKWVHRSTYGEIVMTQPPQLDYLGSNPSLPTYQLCDFVKVTDLSGPWSVRL